MFNIKFKGEPYLLVGNLETGGPIATPEQYSHGILSYAHLCRDGRVMRRREVIGSRDDIEVLGPAEEPEIAADAYVNVIKGLFTLFLR